jgi:hypothetical protein
VMVYGFAQQYAHFRAPPRHTHGVSRSGALAQ